MPTTARQIREQLQVVVQRASGVDRVHLYERVVTDWSRFMNLLGERRPDGGWRVHAWMIGRATERTLTAVADEIDTLWAMGKQARPYVYRLTGIYGVRDSDQTEMVFEDIVEAVMDAVEAEADLGGVTTFKYGLGPTVLQAWDVRQFGSVLCHVAEILVPVVVPRDVSYG